MAGKVGKPLKFETPEVLQKKIDAYFEECELRGRNKDGMLIKPYTISALAFALGTSRKVLLEYEKEESRKEYRNAIKTAKARIESFQEEFLLTTRAPTGIIFSLKNNYNWVDRQEREYSTDPDRPMVTKIIREVIDPNVKS